MRTHALREFSVKIDLMTECANIVAIQCVLCLFVDSER
jgi:hypothetical protein